MSDDDHEPDAAVEAFEQIRGEMALMRRAVERLAAERAEVPTIPDYSETLGRMAKALNATMQNVGVLAKAAEDNVAPRYVADRIVAAGAHARDEDRRMIASAGEKMERATTALHGIGGGARRADKQRRMLWQVGAAAFLGGVLLWALLAGGIARALPASWQWPEKMAARTLRMSMWEAGRHLLIVDSPESWNALVEGWNVVRDNRKTIEGCRKAAAKAGESVRCTIRIAPERPAT